ncbi:MAG: hypothetical protein WBA13_06565 [Microcoleaceae cyanobacterium]
MSNFKFGVRLAGLTLTALGMSAAIFCQASMAQYQESTDPLTDFNRRNVEGQSDNGINPNMISDLIHQAQQGGFNIDYEAIQMRQNQSIQDAATEFRERQRQLLQQQEAEMIDIDRTENLQ